MAAWLGPWAWNSVILGSSPTSTGLFLSSAFRQLFSSLARHASGQLVDFALVGSPVSFLLNKSCQSNFFVKFEGGFIYSVFPTEERFTTALRSNCSRTLLACIRLIETYCFFNLFAVHSYFTLWYVQSRLSASLRAGSWAAEMCLSQGVFAERWWPNLWW